MAKRVPTISRRFQVASADPTAWFFAGLAIFALAVAVHGLSQAFAGPMIDASAAATAGGAIAPALTGLVIGG